MPAEDTVLTDTLSAGCSALSDDADDSNPVDPASVLVRLTDEDDEIVLELPAVVGSADEYLAEASVAEVPPGRYIVTCVAGDTAVPPRIGTASVDVLVDHGPSIEPVVPLADGYLSRAGLHDFEVKIRPVPLFSGDDDAELEGDPLIDIDHQTFTLEPKGDEYPDVYIIEGIDFENDVLFPEAPPDLTAVRVTAENGRSVTGELDYTVAVDGTGPDITIASPAAATIIGSRVTFVFQIVDDFSGVDWSSLVVEAKDVPIPFDVESSRWTQTGNTATLELNTTEYSAATQMSINVSVADVAGNISDNGAGSTYYLDQVPPILSLDPPNVRIVLNEECSHSFDPAGSFAVSHGDNTPNLVLFRGMAWDDTNHEEGQIIAHYSTVDRESIRLWVSRADQPLVVDTSDPPDGICDGISSAADADVDAVEMIPINAGGTAYFGDGTGDLSAPTMAGICAYAASPAAEPPDGLCSNLSDLSYAIGQKFDNQAVPALYAPLVGGGASCTGNQQSVGALLGTYEGWVCAAVTGQDLAGNSTVSAPIAFCLDSPEIAGDPPCEAEDPSTVACAASCIPAEFPETGFIIDPNWGG